MTDLKWRDSQLSASPPQTEIHNLASDISNGTGYAEEHKPQVVKHEQLLAEELQIVQKGLETTKSLINWYENRLESLEKRKKMLDKRNGCFGFSCSRTKTQIFTELKFNRIESSK